MREWAELHWVRARAFVAATVALVFPCAAPASGPDVIVGEIHQVMYHGSVAGGTAAVSIGTISCNIGDFPLDWFATTNRHPVIAQNMFRLAGGRFEQIGMSWLKHGFFAEQGELCSGPGGCQPQPSGTRLGVGCSDPYSASLNGSVGLLGPRSQVNPHTGEFPFPFTAPMAPATVGRRLQFHLGDVLPSLNPGALYYFEGQYVTPDDAAAGHQDNNASHRPVAITGNVATLAFALTGTTQRGLSALRAWREIDADVVETEIRVPADGMFLLAAKATDLGDGTWHYEYALQNLNVHRAAGAFRVPLRGDEVIGSIGFHDVHHHSGEPYDTSDWVPQGEATEISWLTEPFAVEPNANALRWGTLYNFRFVADRPPVSTRVQIDLFRPGGVEYVTGTTVGPAPSDCNGNGIADECDVACGGACDLAGCGGSFDVNGNGVPDECDPDCNGNGVPDDQDVLDGALDCDANTVPDECEMDADGDGVIDACDECPLEFQNDADGDGVCAPEDGCPEDPFKIDAGSCGCGIPDLDEDGDLIADCVDNCPEQSNPGQADSDGDGVGDLCDNCPADLNSGQMDGDGDGLGDECDACPLDFHNDADGDGVCAPVDECPDDPFKTAPLNCGCHVADTDGDGDGTADCLDGCPADPAKLEPGACGCHRPEVDTDGDSVPDCVDACPGVDDRFDFDGDGIQDCVEAIPSVSSWGVVQLLLLLLTAAKLRDLRAYHRASGADV